MTLRCFFWKNSSRLLSTTLVVPCLRRHNFCMYSIRLASPSRSLRINTISDWITLSSRGSKAKLCFLTSGDLLLESFLFSFFDTVESNRSKAELKY